MSHEHVDKNKISDAQKRQAEHIKDRLEDQGLGQDHAEKEALAAVAQEPNRGGANSAGDPKKGVNHEGSRRNGSAKEAG